jgi:hypothetical protein
MVLVFIPAAIIIAITGPIYGRKKDGQVFEIPRAQKVRLIILWLAVIIVNVIIRLN